jgi:hypothetical protein
MDSRRIQGGEICGLGSEEIIFLESVLGENESLINQFNGLPAEIKFDNECREYFL